MKFIGDEPAEGIPGPPVESVKNSLRIVNLGFLIVEEVEINLVSTINSGSLRQAMLQENGAATVRKSEPHNVLERL
ncbi:MAG TPA: hypothetical protein VIM11_22835 [Tepidisphaeraceae bacterium]